MRIKSTIVLPFGILIKKRDIKIRLLSLVSGTRCIQSLLALLYTTMAKVQDVFFAFGDSLTQGNCDHGGTIGFVARLASKYVRKFDVLNRGFSGYNTRWAIPLFEQVSIRNTILRN